MKLSEVMKGKFLVDVLITGFEPQMTATGEPFAILHLKNPIPEVTGSRTITGVDNTESERLKAWDVIELKVAGANLDHEDIHMEKDGTGTIQSSSLRLDVANSGDVWLVTESFAQFGRTQRQNRTAERRSGLISKMQDRKAKAAFGSTTIKETVENIVNPPIVTPEAVEAEAGK